jgi:arsenite methyltransferase
VSARDLKETVREKYGDAARRVSSGETASCCATTCCGGSDQATDPITANLYSGAETATLPEKAVLASLGCGNPTALAELHQGEIVLDLGSGGGIDVLLSARRVGPTGKAYGLDMTDEMLELARENQRKAGVKNVEFLKGEIEAIPLPDSSVDVIISNCVINLSTDKGQVLREAFRVLKPGGRFAVSDVVIRGEVPAEVRRSMELWVGCVAGALTEQQYQDRLSEAGFEAIGIEPTRVYEFEDARAFLGGTGLDAERLAREVEGRVMGAFIRARKPGPCVTLRSAQSGDLPKVLDLLTRSGLPSAGVADALPHFVTAESAGQLVGVVGLELYGSSALLRSAAVEEGWRGTGVGRTLIERALDLAREQGIEDVFLLTTTAEHYFPRFGFACVSRDSVADAVKASVEFKEACPASATVMRKTLAS